MRFKVTAMTGMLAFAGAAQAQTSIQVYGTIDSGLFHQNTSAASFSPTAKDTGSITRLKDGGIYSSNVGFKGSEDIGGGYQVNFKLQGVYDSASGRFGLSDTTGVGTLFNQFATIGVSGPIGTFIAGRQIIPMIYAMADTDVRAAQYFGSILTGWIGINTAAGWPGTNTNTPIGALYDSNALVYNSPVFGGFSAGLEYGVGEVAGSAKAGSRQSVVLKYGNAGLKLSAAYYNAYDTNPAAGAAKTGVNNNRMVYLGGLYAFDKLTVSASYTKGKNPEASDRAHFDLYGLGLGYQFTPLFKVTSGAYYIKDKNVSANSSTEYVVGAEYSLSKRTIAYAQVGYVNNKGTMNQAIEFAAPVAPGLSTTATMLGVRHLF
jgi:predicted porin